MIMMSQLELMRVNNSDDIQSSDGEKGHCLAVSVNKEIDEDALTKNVELSNKGHVVFSKSGSMKASECQLFFMEEIPSVVRSDFFNVHISFFSLTF